MKHPKIIFIGPHDYEVSISKKKIDSNLFGETDNTNSEIHVHPDQSLQNKRDTLLHEILHAIAFASGMKKVLEWNDETEEKVIRLLSPWLLGVVQDNPDLIEWITEQK